MEKLTERETRYAHAIQEWIKQHWQGTPFVTKLSRPQTAAVIRKSGFSESLIEKMGEAQEYIRGQRADNISPTHLGEVPLTDFTDTSSRYSRSSRRKA